MQHHRNLFRPIWSSRRSKQTENVVVRIIILFPRQSTLLLFFISRSILTKQRKCSHSHSPVATQAHPAISSTQTLVARDNRHYRSNNSVWSASIQRIHHWSHCSCVAHFIPGSLLGSMAFNIIVNKEVTWLEYMRVKHATKSYINYTIIYRVESKLILARKRHK